MQHRTAEFLPPELRLKRYFIRGRLRRLPPLNPALHQRVDVRFNPRDFLVCLLGSFGFSTDCIARRTGLTPYQVSYRLGKKHGKVYRKDYRNGRSDFAKLILDRTSKSAAPMLDRKFQTLRLPKMAAA